MSPKRTAKKRTWFADKSGAEIKEHVKKFKKLDELIEKNKRIPPEMLDMIIRGKGVKKEPEQLKQLRIRIQDSLKVSRDALERRVRTPGITAREREKLMKRRTEIDTHVVTKLLDGGANGMVAIKTCVGIGMSPNYAKLLVKRMQRVRLAQGKRP